MNADKESKRSAIYKDVATIILAQFAEYKLEIPSYEDACAKYKK